MKKYGTKINNVIKVGIIGNFIFLISFVLSIVHNKHAILIKWKLIFFKLLKYETTKI